MSQEDEDDLQRVWNWFIEELFTYVRVYGSLAHPHVLPLFIPYKILRIEIAYQIVRFDISKILKDSNRGRVHIFLLNLICFP